MATTRAQLADYNDDERFRAACRMAGACAGVRERARWNRRDGLAFYAWSNSSDRARLAELKRERRPFINQAATTGR